VIKVSIVVPVYNPGAHIEDLIRSLLSQTLPQDAYEVIFVDDGSTDETPARLDELAAAHHFIRAVRIPRSGWPGRPRNIGTDLANGEFVLYVDNDDWLAPEALARLYARAVEDDADVVVGKVVGHGRAISSALFAENRSRVSLDWDPLLQLLTPHKLFRLSFLRMHNIRFPEGRRRLEDHPFVVRAYFAAGHRISILADYPCYHWVLRSSEVNASSTRLEPVGYYANLREVLDIVEVNAATADDRRRLLAHWYRSKALRRLRGRAFAQRDPDYNREIYHAVRTLVLERFPPELDELLSLPDRARSHMVRRDDIDGLYELSRFEAGLSARALVSANGTRVTTVGRLRRNEGRLRFRRSRDRVVWAPPTSLRPHLEQLDLEAVGATKALPLIRRDSDGAEYALPTTSALRLSPAARGLMPLVESVAGLEPGSAAGGSPLSPGRWQLAVHVSIAGFSATAERVRTVAPDGAETERRPFVFDVDVSGRVGELSAVRVPPCGHN
jgi:glycosyltransferase involved in cell wall biosynthesis